MFHEVRGVLAVASAESGDDSTKIVIGSALIATGLNLLANIQMDRAAVEFERSVRVMEHSK